ncbi:TonB-dependent receptor domain-containing protein, partial [Escherichia coli]|uniref:TonB-dependent receptor domain-containing protein n=1 Tax=Escherichia coli TaxID=562 RepID=UPI00228479B2
APPSPAAFLVANDEDPSMAYERADSEDNQMQLLREGLAELDRGLQLIASYSYNQGKVVKSNDPAEIGKVPSYQPRHLASLWLDYRLPQGPLAGLGLGAGARYVGASYGDKLNLMRNPA